MKELTYIEAYANNSFSEFIQSLGRTESNNDVRLDTSIGQGLIKLYDIEHGLQLRLWDCQFNKDVVINRAIHQNKQDRTFTLVYYMTPESFRLENCYNSPMVISSLWNTVMMSSDARFSVRLLRGRQLRCFSINFTPAWLELYILNDPLLNNHFLELFVKAMTPFVFFESYSHDEKEIINSLFDEKSTIIGNFFYRSKVLGILTKFFTKISGRHSLYSGADLYHEQAIIEVEKILIANINIGLPNLKRLAQQFALSESTLRRYFKRQYGMNIYSYFLEKRMSYAKELLEGKKVTVTEVAYMMGYEKVSQFSNLFKRYYGLLPGAIQRRKLLQHVK
jgi:AraC-like DNA-binding protein